MPPPILRDQPLVDHAAQRRRELDPDLGLLLGGEDVDHAADRLGGVVGVQGGEDQVAGLGHGEREPDRLEVAHLADEQDVGVLAQHAAQGVGEVRGVGADLALVDRRQLVVVDVLDRVLDGDDVAAAGAVDRSMSEARVVDLPEPVGPVIRTRPWCRSDRSRSTGGRPRSSGDGIARGIIRSATAVSPRWVNALPRIRASSRQEKEKSNSVAGVPGLGLLGGEHLGEQRVGVVGGQGTGPGTGVSVPSTRSIGGRPTVSSRSVPPACQRAASSPSIRLPMRCRSCAWWCPSGRSGVGWQWMAEGGPRRRRGPPVRTVIRAAAGDGAGRACRSWRRRRRHRVAFRNLAGDQARRCRPGSCRSWRCTPRRRVSTVLQSALLRRGLAAVGDAAHRRRRCRRGRRG